MNLIPRDSMKGGAILLMIGLVVVFGIYGWTMGVQDYEIKSNSSSIAFSYGAGAIISLFGAILFFYGLIRYTAGNKLRQKR